MRPLYLIFGLMFFSLGVASQTNPVISGRSAFKPVKAGRVQAVKKVKEVPYLIIKEEAFEDPNYNNIIDGNENSAIRFTIENTGTGVANYVKAIVSTKNKPINGLEFRATSIIDQINPAETKEVRVPIQGKIGLERGLAEFKIEVTEDRGFDASPLEMIIETHPFQPPHVIIADAKFSTDNGGQLELNTPIQMRFLVQNIGNSDALDVKVSCALPNGDCVLTGESDKFEVGRLGKGESRELEFLFVATKRYKLKEIPIRLSVSESFNKYGHDTTVSVAIDQELLAQSMVVITAIPAVNEPVQIVSLTSSVDKNIPAGPGVNNKRFALIIGNEDYSRCQTGLQTEMNVQFARNDASVFKEYATRVLGFPEENVYLLLDATTGEMNQKMELVSKLVAKTGPDAELLFYYAGHGLPDENSRTPYLIPVDVSGASLNSAIKLAEVYKKFAATNCKRITIFLDACFSGGGRESGLLASRSIRMKPSEEPVNGNMVVFSATSGEQSAMSYKNEKHGLFTFFLLKKLQETAGNITYGNLADYLIKTVSIESLKINQKEQDPEVNVSAAVSSSWEGWMLN